MGALGAAPLQAFGHGRQGELGDAGDALFAVVTGKIRISTGNAAGREVFLNIMEPGDTFGEMSVLLKSPPSADVIAVQQSRCLVLAAPILFHVAFRDKYAGGQDVFALTAIYLGWEGMAALATAYLWCAERPGLGSVPLAVEAMRRGARDYIEKPWDNQRLVRTLKTQLELGSALRKSQRLESENRALRRDGAALLAGSQDVGGGLNPHAHFTCLACHGRSRAAGSGMQGLPPDPGLSARSPELTPTGPSTRRHRAGCRHHSRADE